MLALTVWQPWATAIAELGKDVENRSWRPPRRVIGTRIAIHAGQRFDDAAAEWIAEHVAGVTPLWLAQQPRGALLATAVVAGVVTSSRSMWYARGRFGWELREVLALRRAVPCRGAQGLWVVPRHLEEAIAA